ncbi:MAG: transposase [Candidatus Tisiphia sp.]
MTNCIASNYQFTKVKNRQLAINFTGGDISSDGGALLLGEADRRLGILGQLQELASSCLKHNC